MTGNLTELGPLSLRESAPAPAPLVYSEPCQCGF